MSEHSYAISEIVGTSSESIDSAVRNAVARASATLRNLDWFEVVNTRGMVSGGGVKYYQVTIKIGFRLEDVDASSTGDSTEPATVMW